MTPEERADLAEYWRVSFLLQKSRNEYAASEEAMTLHKPENPSEWQQQREDAAYKTGRRNAYEDAAKHLESLIIEDKGTVAATLRHCAAAIRARKP